MLNNLKVDYGEPLIKLDFYKKLYIKHMFQFGQPCQSFFLIWLMLIACITCSFDNSISGGSISLISLD